MTRALIINEELRGLVKIAMEKARANPVPMTLLSQGEVKKPIITLADRVPGSFRPPSQHVSIPMGYRASYSVEEQPPGLCGHLSISVDTVGMCPSYEAAIAIAELFELQPIKTWLEEFEPGHHAINFVGLLK